MEVDRDVISAIKNGLQIELEKVYNEKKDLYLKNLEHELDNKKVEIINNILENVCITGNFNIDSMCTQINIQFKSIR